MITVEPLDKFGVGLYKADDFWVLSLGFFCVVRVSNERVKHDALFVHREKNKTPEPKNMNCFTDMMMDNKGNDSEYTFVLQDVETERVWLHRVKNAPDSSKETIEIMKNREFMGWGKNVKVIGVLSQDALTKGL